MASICEPMNPSRAAPRCRSPTIRLHENAEPDPPCRAGRACWTPATAASRRCTRPRRWCHRHALEAGRDLYGEDRGGGDSSATAPSPSARTRDPVLIGQLDDFLGLVREPVRRKARGPRHRRRRSYRLTIHSYGRDGGDGGAGAGARDPRPRARLRARRGRPRPQEVAQAVLSHGPHQHAAQRLPRPALQGGQHGDSLLALRPRRRGRCSASACPRRRCRTTPTRCSPSSMRGRADGPDPRHRQVCKSKNAGPFELTIDVRVRQRRAVRAGEGHRRALRRRCSPGCTAWRRPRCCSPPTPPAAPSRRRCRGWCRPATSATPMSMARSSMRRCSMSTSRSSATPAGSARS